MARAVPGRKASRLAELATCGSECSKVACLREHSAYLAPTAAVNGPTAMDNTVLLRWCAWFEMSQDKDNRRSAHDRSTCFHRVLGQPSQQWTTECRNTCWPHQQLGLKPDARTTSCCPHASTTSPPPVATDHGGGESKGPAQQPSRSIRSNE